MKEILVLSGKGGTGKTTLVGAMAVIMPDKVLADCDVDAADLHLLLSPEVSERNEFWSGVKAGVDTGRCSGCGSCFEICRFDAVIMAETAVIDDFHCEGCGVCYEFCPEGAISLRDNRSGMWFKSVTKYGPMIHAALGIGEENSGKLVSLVKKEIRALAEEQGVRWILVDGPPGLGCPVIAALSGADLVLIVTEPTMSGLHDMIRVADLAEHFKIPVCVCINKWDLNRNMADNIENECRVRKIPVTGHVPFDADVVNSLVAGRPLLEYSDGPAAREIQNIWKNLKNISFLEENE
ncbi:MAG TPA: (4Fe-4S)-binding protein [Thermodesulfobacteriaceae bacterium]|nr:(4Fe-4S)-binding protein [Thermodesulfobacteriaceae bacterium]